MVGLSATGGLPRRSYIVISHKQIVASFNLVIFAGQFSLQGAGECDGFAANNQGVTVLASRDFAATSHKLAFSIPLG